jgi:hypothetical protein
MAKFIETTNGTHLNLDQVRRFRPVTNKYGGEHLIAVTDDDDQRECCRRSNWELTSAFGTKRTCAFALQMSACDP